MERASRKAWVRRQVHATLAVQYDARRESESDRYSRASQEVNSLAGTRVPM